MTPRGGYRRRIVDTELDFLIANLFAIAIDGPKAVGKTATAEQRAATVHRLDTDPLDLIEADPSRLTDAPEPILIVEWQHWPPSWDFVRRAVDDDPGPDVSSSRAPPACETPRPTRVPGGSSAYGCDPSPCLNAARSPPRCPWPIS